MIKLDRSWATLGGERSIKHFLYEFTEKNVNGTFLYDFFMLLCGPMNTN